MDQRLAARVEQWRSQLLDLTKRNRLINCQIGKSGAIAIDHPKTTDIWRKLVLGGAEMRFPLKATLLEREEDDGQLRLLEDAPAGNGRPGADSTAATAAEWKQCLASPHLGDNDLLTALADKPLYGRLYRLSLAAQTSLSERGVNTLYAAFGLLKWYESQDSDTPMLAPLLLVPVRLTRPSTDSLWELSLHEEEVVANHSLAELLRLNFRLQMPKVDEERLLDRPAALAEYFEAVAACVADHKRWEVRPAACVGNFSFQKLAMYTDLGKNGERIAKHNLCRAIGGEPAEIGTAAGVPTAGELDDRVPPQENHHILDADSSQHEAILAVKRGVSLVLDGPPGTGKSQTIANVIAEMIAQGKSVLFVSEKAAALEVVKRRLDREGLGDFCLECHSHKANKKQVIEELGRCVALAPERHRRQDEDLEDLRRTRDQLNGYVRAIHARRGALDLSAYQVHGRLAQLLGRPTSRCPVPRPLDVDAAALKETTHAIAQLVDVAECLKAGRSHPWYGAAADAYSLTLEDDVRHHFGVLATRLPRVLAAVGELVACGFVGARPAWGEVRAGRDAAARALAFPLLPAAWFGGDPRRTAERFLELHDRSVAARKLSAAVPEYTDAAVADRDRAWLAPLRPDDLWCTRLAGRPRTVRALLAAAQDAFARLGKVLAGLSMLKKATEALIAELKVGLTGELMLEHYPKLAELGRAVAEAGELHPTWFEPDTRATLRRAADECLAERGRLAADRARLASTFARHAFEPAALPALEAARGFESFWSRLTPRWTRTRNGLRELLAEGRVLSTRALLDAASRLRRYHAQAAALDAAERAHAGRGIAFLPEGADWPAVLRGLAQVERLEAVAPVTPKLREALCAPGVVDRDGAARAAAGLRKAIDVLAAVVKQAADTVGVSTLDPAQLWQPQRSFRQFGEWVVAARKALADRVDHLAKLAERLRAGADVAAVRCAADFDALDQVHGLAQRIAQLRAELGVPADASEPGHARSWEPEATLARATIELLSVVGEPPPGPVLRAVTDAAFRDLVSRGVTAVNEESEDGALNRGREFLTSLFPPGHTASLGAEVGAAPLAELAPWLQARAADAYRLTEWVNYQDVKRNLAARGLAPVHDEVAAGAYPAADAVDAFLQRFYRLWLDAVYAGEPHLRRFEADEHERLVRKFRELDQACLRRTYQRVRGAQLADRDTLASGSWSAPASSEAGVLLREANKKRRQLPLRLLFQRIPNLLRKLKPCLMMSPLAVSTYLDSDEIEFDLVVFDEASQVRPHDAISAIYRGKQLVVAGDQKQLPPSSFFERGVDGDADADEDSDEAAADGAGDTSDFESILDVCRTLGMPRKRLRWHYRSRREALIAFSNRHFYDNELVTFPSALELSGDGGVRHEFVADGVWQGGTGGGVNMPEAARTVDLILRHAREHPDRSLGVITMNQRQQYAVLELLEQRRRESPECEEFFSEAVEEPFFVKNLENVQGDERDFILISVGYGKDAAGDFAMRFGPLNLDGGERRLNVAVTRARLSTTLVSSIRAGDMDPQRARSVGAQLLRAYLDFAERGIEAFRAENRQAPGAQYESLFEEEVAKELLARGLDVRPQIGCGGFRIDLGIVHPKQPGRFALGVECDGASYHSSATARDRDRLRQSILEGLGWRICRIWSTDWVRNPDKQIRRVMAAYEAAVDAPVEEPRREPVRRVEVEPKSPPNADVQAPARSRPQAGSGSPAANGRRARAAVTATAQVPQYNDITDVPGEVIEVTAVEMLTQFGATAEEELTVGLARRLGFNRTGSRIRSRIRRSLAKLKREGRVRAGEDGRLFALKQP